MARGQDAQTRLRITPLRTVASGVVAGAVGTPAMDALWYTSYRRGGGDSALVAWEFSSGLSSWEQAPAPAQVGKRLVEGLFQIELPPARAALTANVMHWGYGMLGGAHYGIIAGR